MLFLKSYQNVNCCKCSWLQKLEISKKYLSTNTYLYFPVETKLVNNNETEKSSTKDKLLFNSVLNAKNPRLGFFKARRLYAQQQELKHLIQPLPLSLKFLSDDLLTEKVTDKVEEQQISESNKNVQFPYSSVSSPVSEFKTEIKNEDLQEYSPETIDKEVRAKNNELRRWMNAYDNLERDIVEDGEDGTINYGTPDPKSVISDVPCGGCGALLHCKDTAIPGYIPSEIFKNAHRPGAATLEAIICQRCFFLKEHNIALQVRVSADDYPKVLMSLANKMSLVILMVDLTDFPCSIWPGIADILGPKTPIFVVGNKIDLIPKDDVKFIPNIKQKVVDYMKLNGFGTSKILDVALISAKTGYGIEDLITSLHSLWKVKGDVYLVGCTNVGKSSLFNALLGSDYCKIQAADLIQRATTSQWPGTTLNLLKFPVMKLSSHRLYLRNLRLTEMNKSTFVEENRRREQLKAHNVAENATLIGRIEQTFSKYTKYSRLPEKADSFSAQTQPNNSGRTTMGVNENHPDYASGRWCYDTPGVVHPDQLLDLLTLEELILTLPKELIRPETFCVKPGTSLFIAGLARLDYLKGPDSIKLTVFRSNELPITICDLNRADQTYEDCLGSELFKVPIDEGDRLSKWPGLSKGKPFTVTGVTRRLSINDVVLSNAGWISITCSGNQKYTLQAWTPEKRGIHLRDSILPKTVTLRGKRIKYTVQYEGHTFI
ncbi:nitric oxide-associated protein 1 [Diabrotica virgifera virgifera]|uniref:Nitric oxide-associated protein 1 n=1 Tax=Diabrotica virgifera virgifera TaxID=50390 RepID=A0ABM5K8N4_DIAVI|nr:nitric oxide-associated protein 1 [Diabrotica virgifera virgifera]